jgi:transposase
MQKRKSYTREFKLEAVRLLERGDRPAADIARELGIKRNQLYKWQEQLAQRGEAAFPGQGRPANDNEAEIARLKRELERVTEERDILKKAAQYFAREPE